MLTVSEALDEILRTVKTAPGQSCSLVESLGRVSAAAVLSDVESPPFDKALMDGYAVRSADIQSNPCQLRVVDEVMAGQLPSRRVEAGEATRIMTGAMLPEGADAVVKVEETESDSEDLVRILANSVRPEQNLIRRGTNLKEGESVLNTGNRLRAQQLSALAEIGADQLLVSPVPRIAVLATGDELVPVNEEPGPGQIRNSNETMLVAQITQAGGEAVPLGIARDEREHLGGLIRTGIQHDFLLLSGGVSAGKLDLVPSELDGAGVRQVFHKVQVKPGKPLWFGVLPREPNPCYVFGLPGNPVSSMVCFELFVRTAIRCFTGEKPVLSEPQPVRLAHAHQHRDKRQTYFPAATTWQTEGPTVTLMNWHGSSDLQATRRANGMAVFPPEPREYQAGDLVEVIPW